MTIKLGNLFIQTRKNSGGIELLTIAFSPVCTVLCINDGRGFLLGFKLVFDVLQACCSYVVLHFIIKSKTVFIQMSGFSH